MKINDISNEYKPQYFTNYFKFEKTLNNKWFELVNDTKELNTTVLLNYIKSITWVEMVQPKLNVFQINEGASDKISVRFSLTGKGEKYWVGRFKYSNEISIFLIEDSRNGSIELFFSECYKNDYLKFVGLLNNTELKNEIKYFRKKAQINKRVL